MRKKRETVKQLGFNAIMLVATVCMALVALIGIPIFFLINTVSNLINFVFGWIINKLPKTAKMFLGAMLNIIQIILYIALIILVLGGIGFGLYQLGTIGTVITAVLVIGSVLLLLVILIGVARAGRSSGFLEYAVMLALLTLGLGCSYLVLSYVLSNP